MMSYPWTPSWNRNIKLVAGFADAVSQVCDASSEDHKMILARCAMRIKNTNLQDAVIEHGAVLAQLLDWIEAGVKRHNHCNRVPDTYMLPQIDLEEYKSAWTKHVIGSRQSLMHLKRAMDDMLEQMQKCEESFVGEETGDYSSYSDYSEDETESDDDEHVSSQRRSHKHRRRSSQHSSPTKEVRTQQPGKENMNH